MTKRPQLIVPASILGVLLLAVAALYFFVDAGSLPSFVPGHESGSTHIHFKHGLLAAILGISSFIFAWFQGGDAAHQDAPGSK